MASMRWRWYRGAIAPVVIGVLVAGLALVGAAPTHADEREVLVVDDDLACLGAAYDTISGAVAASAPGDVIELCAGRYEERVAVGKSLTIRASADAAAAAAELDCLGDAALPIDAARHAVIAATDNAGAPWLELAADDVEVSGLVFLGAGPTTRSTDFSHAIATSREHSGYRLHHNVVLGHDLGVFFNSSGERASEFAFNCLRANRWGLSNVLLPDNFVVGPMVDVRIHHNQTRGTINFAFEALLGATDVTLSDNHSRNDTSGYLVRFTTSTELVRNIVEGTRFGIRLFGGNQGLQIEGNHLAVRQVGVASATALAGVQLPPNLDTVIEKNTITGTGTARFFNGPWAGIGLGGGALVGSKILENVVHDHYGEGIVLLQGNNDNLIAENVVHGNGSNGLRLAAGATGNTLLENRLYDNAVLSEAFPGSVDVRDEAWPLNTWSETTCGTDNPTGAICGVG